MSQPSNFLEVPSVSALKRIQNGTAWLYEASTLMQFMEWWHTTTWAEQMRENLNKAPSSRNEKFSDPRWGSTNCSAPQWSNYGQGAKVKDGKPFVFCLPCNTIVQHPRAFGVGTSHLSNHMTSAKCLRSSGRGKQSIIDMLSKVGSVSQTRFSVVILWKMLTYSRIHKLQLYTALLYFQPNPSNKSF